MNAHEIARLTKEIKRMIDPVFEGDTLLRIQNLLNQFVAGHDIQSNQDHISDDLAVVRKILDMTFSRRYISIYEDVLSEIRQEHDLILSREMSKIFRFCDIFPKFNVSDMIEFNSSIARLDRIRSMCHRVFTGLNDLGLKEKSLETGADAYIYISFPPNSVPETLSELQVAFKKIDSAIKHASAFASDERVSLSVLDISYSRPKIKAKSRLATAAAISGILLALTQAAKNAAETAAIVEQLQNKGVSSETLDAVRRDIDRSRKDSIEELKKKFPRSADERKSLSDQERESSLNHAFSEIEELSKEGFYFDVSLIDSELDKLTTGTGENESAILDAQTDILEFALNANKSFNGMRIASLAQNQENKLLK